MATAIVLALVSDARGPPLGAPRCSPSRPSRWSPWRRSSGGPASARRSLTGEALPTALPRAVGRNRRRYGGYIVHVGIAITLIGIAASSSFQTNRDLRLEVGESADVGDYTVTYERLTADPRNERIAFGAAARRRQGRQAASPPWPRRATTTRPRTRWRGRSAATSRARRPARSACESGAGEDFWTAFQPDLSTLDPAIARGNAQLADLPPDAQGVAILALAESYARRTRRRRTSG